MATPTTVSAFLAERQAALTEAKKKSDDAVRATQKDYADKRAARDAATKELAALDAQVLSIRKRLAEIVTPADAAPLLAELEQKIVEQRSRQARSFDLEEDVKLAQVEADHAGARLQVMVEGLKRVADAITDAQQKEAQRAELKQKLDEEPLSTMGADAEAALTSESFNDAKARLEEDLPATLITRARERRQQAEALLLLRRTSASDALALVSAQLNSSGGTTSKVEKAKQDLERAEQAFRDYVINSKGLFEQSLASLSAVADKTRDPLTDAEIESINDSDLEEDRDDAAEKEKGRDDARADTEEKRMAFETAVLKALAADVDANPADNEDVQDALGMLDTANEKLAEAETDYTAELQKIMDDWEATVPDSTWRQLADFEEAQRLLSDLKSAQPTQLIKAVEDAENALVLTMIALDKGARTLNVLEDEAEKRVAQLDFERDAARRLKFRALRGDN